MDFVSFKKKYQRKEVTHFPSNVLEDNLVSVCIQTYQHKDYIKQCLDGVLMQKTNFPFEILLGEDQSIDGTKEICIEYAKKHPTKIRLFLHRRENNIKINKTPTGRFNFLYNLYQAIGKYIAFCEGDDYWTDPYKLQKQVDFLEANPDYGMCFTRFKTFNQNTNEFQKDGNSKYFDSKAKYIDFNFDIFSEGWHVGTQTLLFERQLLDLSVVNKYKYFRDVHLFTELIKQKKGACLNFFGAVYRIQDNGIYNSMNHHDKTRIAAKIYKELFYKNRKITQLKKKYYFFQKIYISSLNSKLKISQSLLEIIRISVSEKDYKFFIRQISKLFIVLINALKFKLSKN